MRIGGASSWMSRALRDAGMEVIYGGNMTPHDIAEADSAGDVQVVGLSVLAPGYMRLISETLNALRQRGVEDIPVVAGGIIPEEDIPQLKEMGVVEVFRPGTPLRDIVAFFQQWAPRPQALTAR